MKLTASGLAWGLAALFLIVYEGIALLCGWQHLSGWFWQTSREYPLLPFALGVLCGHLVWNEGRK